MALHADGGSSSGTNPSRGRLRDHVGGRDNRTCGFHVVGDSVTNHRMENRVPGADCNPYLAFVRPRSPPGSTASSGGVEPPDRFDRNAYEAHEPHARAAQHRRRHLRASNSTPAAVDAFGARRARAPRQHRAAGGSRSARRHRLGATPLLRAVLTGSEPRANRPRHRYPATQRGVARAARQRSCEEREEVALWRATDCVTGSR